MSGITNTNHTNEKIALAVAGVVVLASQMKDASIGVSQPPPPTHNQRLLLHRDRDVLPLCLGYVDHEDVITGLRVCRYWKNTIEDKRTHTIIFKDSTCLIRNGQTLPVRFRSFFRRIKIDLSREVLDVTELPRPVYFHPRDPFLDPFQYRPLNFPAARTPLGEVLQTFSNVTSITVYQAVQINDADFTYAFEAIKYMKAATPERAPITSLDLRVGSGHLHYNFNASNFTDLRELITNSIHPASLARLTQLRKLQLVDTYGLDLHIFEKIHLLKELHTLIIPAFPLQQRIRSLPSQITHLQVTNQPEISDNFTALHTLRKLEVLDFTMQINMDDSNFVTFIDFLSRLTTLKDLRLQFTPENQPTIPYQTHLYRLHPLTLYNQSQLVLTYLRCGDVTDEVHFARSKVPISLPAAPSTTSLSPNKVPAYAKSIPCSVFGLLNRWKDHIASLSYFHVTNLGFIQDLSLMLTRLSKVVTLRTFIMDTSTTSPKDAKGRKALASVSRSTSTTVTVKDGPEHYQIVQDLCRFLGQQSRLDEVSLDMRQWFRNENIETSAFFVHLQPCTHLKRITLKLPQLTPSDLSTHLRDLLLNQTGLGLLRCNHATILALKSSTVDQLKSKGVTIEVLRAS